jgi:hypothetical protein
MRQSYKFLKLLVAVVAVSLTSFCNGGGESSTACSPTDPSCGAPTPAVTARTLLVPFVPQQTQLWCWAATSEMIFRYYGRPIAQCQLVGVYTGRSTCCLGDPACVVAGGSMQVIQQGLLGVGGIRSQLVNGPITFDQVVTEINASRPVMIGYLGSFQGHVVLIVGYNKTRGTVVIYDPNYGPVEVPYGATFVYGGQLTWFQTLIGITS